VAELTDKDIPERVVAATFERQVVRVKLNGEGGQWPAVTLAAGDTLSVAFKKNAGAWGAIGDTYKVKYDAPAGKVLVAYCVLKIEDE